jgi:hypothetical protein
MAWLKPPRFLLFASECGALNSSIAFGPVAYGPKDRRRGVNFALFWCKSVLSLHFAPI